MDTRILIAEDEKKLNQLITDYLSSIGYKTKSAYTGVEAVHMTQLFNPSLVLIDVMMPEMDGVEAVRLIRKERMVPIIMLSAKATEGDALLGFEVGVDDYITRPVSMQLLAARIRAVLRRATGKAPPDDRGVLRYGPFIMDSRKRTLTKNGQSVFLTPTQFDLLTILMREPGTAFSRVDLIQQTGGYDYEGYDRTIDTHVKNLRKAIEDDPANPTYLKTIWRYGYKLEEVGK